MSISRAGATRYNFVDVTCHFVGRGLVTRDRMASLEKAELQLKDYCQRLHENLGNPTYQDKREILEMLAIKVTATPERIDVQGIIPLETTPTQTSDNSLSLLTTGQTSG